MCGIAVVWDPYRNFNKLTVKLIKDLSHRGPDAENIVSLENSKLFLAHTRLKIIDMSDEANQPFCSPCRRWMLVYNGEIYNFKELKKQLADKWVWKTTCDTEVLLAAWTHWGEKCLNKIKGMFAFVIYDNETKKLYLVRDRFGIKPLYILYKKELIVITSEIQPILKFLDKIEPNNDVIRNYLETGLYDNTSETFFKDIKSILPGSITELNLYQNKRKSKIWYNFSCNLISTSDMNEDEVIFETERLIDEAIKSHLVSDVNVGINVSGGVDSSMLVQKALFQHGDNINLFTQDYPKYSELFWTKKNFEGENLNVEKLDFKKIDSYLLNTVKHQGEPFGGVTVCGYNAIYERANKQKIKVILDGNGIDEAFLGYQKYHQLYVNNSVNDKNFEKIKKDYENFWKTRFVQYKPLSLIDGTIGLKPQVISKNLLKNTKIFNPRIDFFDNSVRNLAATDLFYNKIPRGLRFNDRVSMYHSCELRVPFLHHELVEFAFSIPDKLLLNEKGTKVIFRKILSKYLSNEISFAKKRSVQSPQREWLAKDWEPLVSSILKSKKFYDRNWVNPKAANQVYENYLNGDQENSFFIWQWINLELWARCFLDKDSAYDY